MSGQLIVGVNPSNAVQNCEVTAAGHLKMDIASSGGGAISANVDVTGNSIGLATSANQSTGNSSLSTIASNSTTLAGAVSGSEFQVDVVTSALPSGAATESTLSAAELHLGNIDTSTSSISSNVATSSLQSTANGILTNAEAHLGTIDTSTSTSSSTLTGISAKLPATLGQKAMSAALAVSIASDQSAVPVSSAGANVTASSESATPGAGVTTNSTAADMNGFQHVAIFGSTTNTTGDQFLVQFSNDNSTFYTQQNISASIQTSTGSFGVNIDNVAARYVRVSQPNTTGGSRALTIITSKK